MQKQTQRKPRKVWIRDITPSWPFLVFVFKVCGFVVIQTRIISDRFRQLFIHLCCHVFSWQILTQRAWILFLCILLTKSLWLHLCSVCPVHTRYSQHKHKRKKMEKLPFLVLILMWTSPYIPQSDPVRILILSWSCLVNVAVRSICQNVLIPFQANYFFLYSAILESYHYVTLIPPNLFWTLDIVTGS